MQDNYVLQSSDNSHKHSPKGTLKFESGSWKGTLCVGCVVVMRPDETLSGVAAAATLAKSFLGGRMSLTASLAYYDAGQYDARVYIYEGDLPGSFSLQYYYGKGIAARGLVRAKAGRRLTLSAVAVAAKVPEARVQADINF